ncbi:MAG: hypothetical protein A3G41_06860 [Elusimicrobia bacterium RIFCSPLOWO2_12_FULL_59_9]|nr:MAG: hypothetical protein A3G41_06860 [Elusimicrobia bacterium RIFCSPLOWO2_12_FULL_59_9]
MPSWGEILQEVGALAPTDPAASDTVRRKYIRALQAHTGRATILYASKWTQPGISDPNLLSIVDEDVHGFMEVVRGLGDGGLDLILHSPGGSAEATEAIVSYLRARFSGIRVIVPQAAMSAATMLACASDEIVMGLHSSLGPIDPQMLMQTPLGIRMVPAQAILDQFDQAQEDCKNPAKLGSWMPILGQYGPALLVQCQNALKLSKHLVKDWLARYMFASLARRHATMKAAVVARTLADHRRHMSHGRHFDRALCQSIGFKITSLEADRKLQDLVLSAFHSTMVTFNMTPAAKIIENHLGRAFIKIAMQGQVQLIPQPTRGGKPGSGEQVAPFPPLTAPQKS